MPFHSAVMGTVLSAVTVSLFAQTPADRLAFDVASIKQNKVGGVTGTAGLGFLSGGRFTATNVTVQRLIAAAYGTRQLLPTTRIVGGPDWLIADRFDIVAKTSDPDPALVTNGVPRRLWMLRTLLAERFKLRVHHETQTQPVYALVMARTNKALGSRLHPSRTDCVTRAPDPDAPPAAPRPDERPSCGIGRRGNSLIGGGATMSQLADALSDRADRIVVDRTNLAGTFDLDLAWTPVTTSVATSSNAPDAGVPPPIFTAVRDQLGLKLEPARAPVDVLVIDQIEHPAED